MGRFDHGVRGLKSFLKLGRYGDTEFDGSSGLVSGSTRTALIYEMDE